MLVAFVSCAVASLARPSQSPASASAFWMLGPAIPLLPKSGVLGVKRPNASACSCFAMGVVRSKRKERRGVHGKSGSVLGANDGATSGATRVC